MLSRQTLGVDRVRVAILWPLKSCTHDSGILSNTVLPIMRDGKKYSVGRTRP